VSTVDIELGRDVVTSDGLIFGKIQEFVVDPKERKLAAIVVRYGRFPSEREFIVGWPFIGHVQEENLYLKVNGEQVEQFPEVIRTAFVSGPTTTSATSMAYWGGGDMLAQGSMMGDSIRGGMSVMGEGGAIAPGTRTSFDLVSTNIEFQTNLPENSSVVTHDTEVMTSDEKKLGVVHQVVCEESGVITGFYTRTGRVRRRKFYVPVDLVEAGSHLFIRLRITADEAGRTLVNHES
jgi:sporulation protein YlmC with PRC-barrel domain